MKRTVRFLLLLLLAGIFSIVFWAWGCGLISFQRLSQPITWKKVTPGNTTMSEVLALYGNPDEIKSNGNLINLIYKKHPSFKPRNSVHILIATRKGEKIVVAIFANQLSWGFPPQPYLPPDDYVNLEQVLLLYGKPAKVTWASYTLKRYLLWPEYGIAVIADPMYTKTLTWDEIELDGIIIFEPMNLRKFICSSNRWASLSHFIFPGFKKPIEIPDMRDIYPEDPYDWERLPTPTTTEVP